LLFCRLYVAHCDTHSFPTRRSSDLAMSVRSSGDGRLLPELGGVCGGLAVKLTVALSCLWCGCGCPAGLPGGPRRGRGWFVVASSDRKSTRLNSSHVSISYAVFCLKK